MNPPKKDPFIYHPDDVDDDDESHENKSSVTGTWWYYVENIKKLDVVYDEVNYD